jgi:peptidoglycan/xylan/chitin deacetylase (PgdA/CDA1 family)
MSRHVIKDTVVGLLGIGALARLAAAWSGPSVVVVMMHRFSGNTGGFPGHDPAVLRRVLRELRAAGVELVSLDAALSHFEATSRNGMRTGAPQNRRPRMAFTIDDGYADAVEQAMPVFAEFDCPATCFVTPHIVEARDWYWWDKVDYLLRHSATARLQLQIDRAQVPLVIGSVAERVAAFNKICAAIKLLPTDDVPLLLQQLADQTNVALPEQAPNEYRVLSWSEMRAAESRGWNFGAHTMTHPLLGRCSDERAEWEIAESLAAVRRELHRPSEVFCYPVGRDGDFGVREYDILRRYGVQWALSSTPGRLHDIDELSLDPAWKLRVPRFSYDDRTGGLVRTLLG